MNRIASRWRQQIKRDYIDASVDVLASQCALTVFQIINSIVDLIGGKFMFMVDENTLLCNR